MRSLLRNDFLVLGARVFLGLLFIIVSIDKISDPALFAQSIQNYRIFPKEGALFLATFLPWIELLCGLCLLTGVMVRGSSLLIGLLLIVFTIVISSALLRGLDISCGCFTLDPAADKIGGNKIIENFVLIALSMFLFYSKSAYLSLTNYLQERKNIPS